MIYELIIELFGQIIEIEDGQIIFDVVLCVGIYLLYVCCYGLCVICKVQVVDGEIEQGEVLSFVLMDFEWEEQKCLVCCVMVQSDLVIEVEIEEDLDVENLLVCDFVGVVSCIEMLMLIIKGVWFRFDGVVGMWFQVGQYINLELLDGIGSWVFLVVSLLLVVGEIELNICIVLGGQGMIYVYEWLQVGDWVVIIGFYGCFFVKKLVDLLVIFMVGGFGLFSLCVMIFDLLVEGFVRLIMLVYGQCYFGEFYYYDEFFVLVVQYLNFSYVLVFLYEFEGSGWSGFCGFVYEVVKVYFDNDFCGNKVYLCGLLLMIEVCIVILMQGWLFECDIYIEKFIFVVDVQ